jgi:hypothetical protein
MPIRASLLLAITTDPQDREQATPHSGGWSESFYVNGSTVIERDFFAAWANARASLLAGECSVVGYRQQLYSVAGNKLFPGGSAGGTLNVPGGFPMDMDVPQAALMLNFTVASQPHTIRQRLAGMPDSQVMYGEYQPSPAYKGQVTKYVNGCVDGFGKGGGFAAITHDLTQREIRVVSITPVANPPSAVLVTAGATGAVNGDYIRLHRVRDDDGIPVSGSFMVTATAALPNGQQQYTLAGYQTGQVVVVPNGLARMDVLVVNQITGGNVNRVVVRKVGRPFVSYRGRRSKSRKL